MVPRYAIVGEAFSFSNLILTKGGTAGDPPEEIRMCARITTEILPPKIEKPSAPEYISARNARRIAKRKSRP